MKAGDGKASLPTGPLAKVFIQGLGDPTLFLLSVHSPVL